MDEAVIKYMRKIGRRGGKVQSDAQKKATAENGRNSAIKRRKLSEQDVREIAFQLKHGNKLLKELAKEYGVWPETISRRLQEL